MSKNWHNQIQTIVIYRRQRHSLKLYYILGTKSKYVVLFCSIELIIHCSNCIFNYFLWPKVKWLFIYFIFCSSFQILSEGKRVFCPMCHACVMFLIPIVYTVFIHNVLHIWSKIEGFIQVCIGIMKPAYWYIVTATCATVHVILQHCDSFQQLFWH
jgi:hypothetical protein